MIAEKRKLSFSFLFSFYYLSAAPADNVRDTSWIQFVRLFTFNCSRSEESLA